MAQPGAPAEGPRTAALHKAIRDEKHAEAGKLADAMLKSSNDSDRKAAAVAYGRVLLSLGEKERARQYLGFMANQKLEGDATEVMKVYAAWLAALDGNFDEAVKTLEPMLAGEPHGPAPVEAADVLAQLHLAAAFEEDAPTSSAPEPLQDVLRGAFGDAPAASAARPAPAADFGAWIAARAVPLALIGSGVVVVAVTLGSLGMKRARHRNEVLRRYRP